MSVCGLSTESVENLWIEPRYRPVANANIERFTKLHQIGALSHLRKTTPLCGCSSSRIACRIAAVVWPSHRGQASRPHVTDHVACDGESNSGQRQRFGVGDDDRSTRRQRGC